MEPFVSPDITTPGEGKLQIFLALEKQIQQFEKISLNEMDAVQLQDRMDTKLIFHINQLPSILNEMKSGYSVFEINNYRINPYHTLYFDDQNWKLYLMHHNQKSNRFKLRYRSYLSSGISFFEVKYKNNKNRTVKERIKVPEIQTEIEGKAKELLSEIIPGVLPDFKPVLWVNYSRITFVSKAKSERVTIDINLAFKNKEKQLALDELVIAEVKQGRASAGSPFLKIMKSRGLRQVSISKYCMGVILLHEHIKMNNFKSKLMAVNKILFQPGIKENSTW